MRNLYLILLLLLASLFLPPTAQAADIICSWHHGDCYTTVFDTGSGWQMWIGCLDGDGGIWSGNGTWGGACGN